MIRSAVGSQTVTILSYGGANWAAAELRLSWALFCYRNMVTALKDRKREKFSWSISHREIRYMARCSAAQQPRSDAQ
jgi:hypothetical protein